MPPWRVAGRPVRPTRAAGVGLERPVGAACNPMTADELPEGRGFGYLTLFRPADAQDKSSSVWRRAGATSVLMADPWTKATG